MNMKLSEANIRVVLLRSLRDNAANAVQEEVKIEGGTARIDVVSFGNEIVGYEIKSDFDNFNRMSNQIHAYNRVFPKIYFVCGQRHLNYALAILPDWWGIMQALPTESGLHLQNIREAKPHAGQDPYSVASLLSREDAINLLDSYKAAVRPCSSIRTIWEAMALHIPLRKIEESIVHMKLKSEPNTTLSLFQHD
jgi:hypothetical protein